MRRSLMQREGMRSREAWELREGKDNAETQRAQRGAEEWEL
jgi:hypothetical protein